ncbi:MAG: DUF3189 family protein [Syntrophomonadaceae bacterium]|jgi:hypothetical protein|nr:DUF3189 family protein [Syntrophomonadaceae bacterium]
MKIIFLGHNPIQAALIAAHIYLDKLPSLEQPESLEKLPYRDLLLGPLYIGSDSKGNQVYTLGGGKDLWMVKRSIEDLRNILSFAAGDLLVESVSTRGDRILGWLSKVPPFLGGRHLNLLARQILWRFQHRVLEELVARVKPG